MGTLKDSQTALCKRSISLSLSLSIYIYIYGSSVRETRKEGYFTGNSESYRRHVKEGFGNGASLSLQRLCEGNLEGGLLY